MRPRRRFVALATAVLVGACVAPVSSAHVAAEVERVPFAQVVAGSFGSSAAITPDGHVFTWGDLGEGDTTPRSSPTLLQGIPEAVASLGVGDAHMLLSTVSGKVWGWGDNSLGQLGLGSSSARPRPLTDLPASDPVIAVRATLYASAAVTRSGRLFLWGQTMDYGKPSPPEAVAGLPAGDPVVDVALAVGSRPRDSHILALTASGAVYAWGTNDLGQLGLGHTTAVAKPTRVVGLPASDPVVEISAGGLTSFALTRSGQLWSWGSNAFGQLGQGIDPELLSYSPSPSQTGGPLSQMPVRHVSGFGGAFLAVTSLGKVFSWGTGNGGRLGLPECAGHGCWVGGPTQVAISGVQHASVGWANGFAVTSDGGLWSWGDASDGKLGNGWDGVTGRLLEPGRIDAPAKSSVTVSGTVLEPAISRGSAVPVVVQVTAPSPAHLGGGSVTVSAGGVTASSPLGFDANDTRTLVLRDLPVGTHTVTVGFTGSSIACATAAVARQVSVSVASVDREVVKAKPKITLSVAKKKVSRGAAVKLQAKATLGKAKVNGKVRVQWGEKKRTLKLRNGRATTTIRGLKPGRHTIRATFLETQTLKTAHAKPVRVRVTKAR